MEKPDEATARRLASSGKHYWNSGIFVFSAAKCVDEMRRLQPTLLESCLHAVQAGRSDLEFTRLDEAAFAAAPSISFDYAIMEHTQAGAVIPVDMGWRDVGSWKTLWEAHEKDGAGNALRGDVIVRDVSGTLIHAQNRMVAALGVQDLVIVETRDAVLVAHKITAQDVPRIVQITESRIKCPLCISAVAAAIGAKPLAGAANAPGQSPCVRSSS